MDRQYHILNGDALKERFPQKIDGEIIVMRECLVDGNVQGADLEEFYHNRARYLNGYMDDTNQNDYFNYTVVELQKIQSMKAPAEVNLWFEDDLFCQVNFWFTLYFLKNSKNLNPVYLIRPDVHTQFGFAGLTDDQLINRYHNRLHLENQEEIGHLWELYQSGKTAKMLELAQIMEGRYPFILPAVKAHIDRLPIEGSLGRPHQTIKKIMQELNTKEFGPIFQEFCRRESIYGFGDLQVKRFLKEVIRNEFR